MVSRNNWNVKADLASMESDPVVAELSERLELVTPVAQLLKNRGCTTPEEAMRYITKRAEMLYDPFLMKDMDRAVSRIVKALESGEKTVIFGDYDVDGVTSVTVLYLYLKSRGGNVAYYIPNRSEGYGMNGEAIKRLVGEGNTLFVTVDTGVTAVGEVEAARELGADVVVTDHHECSSVLPDAAAVVNPQRPDCGYPFKDLAGVGVAFKLVCALERTLNPEEPVIDGIRRVSDEYCDLVALGTIADVMPLADENRLIVSYGLSMISTLPRTGIEALMEASRLESRHMTKRKVTTSFIAYTLAPRLNAAGRVRDASLSVRLLIEQDRARADAIAAELCEINRERQNEENRIAEEALGMVGAEHDFEKEPAVILENDSWHQGVIGIVASRISEKFMCPSILISFDGTDGDTGKGSGRSVEGINLVEALSHCSDLLVKYGGHELAAGLTIRRKDLGAFRERLNGYIRSVSPSGRSVRTVEAECELRHEYLTDDLVTQMGYLEPYGTSNPVPVFFMRDLEISNMASIGEGKHTRMSLRAGNTFLSAVFFRTSADELDVYPGDVIDILFNAETNEYLGRRTVQLLLKDIKLSEKQYGDEEEQDRIYSAIKSGGALPAGIGAGPFVPDRSECAGVYRFLKNECGNGTSAWTLRRLRYRLATEGMRLDGVKIRLILDIFSELGFTETDAGKGAKDRYEIRMKETEGRKPLETSELYSRLRAGCLS